MLPVATSPDSGPVSRGTAAVAALVAFAAAGCGGARPDARPPTAWRSLGTPTLPGTALFAGVSCVSDSFCLAVGSHLQRLVSHTLVERWDGSSWTIVPTSAPADRRSNLTGVSCVSGWTGFQSRRSMCAYGKNWVLGERIASRSGFKA